MRIFISFFVFTFFSFSILAQNRTKHDKSFEESINRGLSIYGSFCISCHMSNGEGVNSIFPPLAKSDYLLKDRQTIIKAVKFGLRGEIIVNGKQYNSIMTPLGLSDKEIADVLNYVTTSWGNSNKKMFTKEEVLEVKK